MKLGLGISTTPKRAIDESVSKFLPKGCEYAIYDDIEGKGISTSRNRLMRALYDEGCDYIALCDDDVKFMYEGWFEYTVGAMQKAKVHMSGLPSNFFSHYRKTVGEMSYWNSIIGSFHVFSRNFIEKVGYFYTGFEAYGFEDAHIQQRAKWSGLIGNTGFPCALRAPFYIHSDDVYHLNPTPNFSKEEKDQYIAINEVIYKELLKSKQVYFPYEQ